MHTQDVSDVGKAIAGLPATVPAVWLGRVSSVIVIVLMLLDGAIRLVPWPMVTEAMDRMGYGSSENLARFLGAVSLSGAALCAFPPTSFVGAILTTGYLGSVLVSHVRIESPLLSDALSGFYFAAVLWGMLWLRGRRMFSSFAS